MPLFFTLRVIIVVVVRKTIMTFELNDVFQSFKQQTQSIMEVTVYCFQQEIPSLESFSSTASLYIQILTFIPIFFVIFPIITNFFENWKYSVLNFFLLFHQSLCDAKNSMILSSFFFLFLLRSSVFYF